jgi:hypothetical protein
MKFRQGLMVLLKKLSLALCLVGGLTPVLSCAADDIALTPSEISFELISPSDHALFHGAAEGLHVTVRSSGTSGFTGLAVRLFLNGQDVSAGMAITLETDRLLADYTRLETNLQYQARLEVRNPEGIIQSRDWVFDTYDAGSTVVVEAEHYNFSGGKFINAPELTYVEGPSNYFNTVATEGIDTRQTSSLGSHFYRPLDRVSLGVTTDSHRPAYSHAQVDDYQASAMEPGEWMNYTRLINAGTYHVFARLAAPPGAWVWGALDQVVAGSTTTLQSVSPLGLFIQPTNYQSGDYAYVPLTDAQGEPLVLRLSGQTTLRFTSYNGALEFNFLVIVPVVDAGRIPPALVLLNPWPGETGVMPDTIIRTRFRQGDDRVDATSLRLYLNGEEITEACIVQETATEVTLSYIPLGFLALDSTNTLQLISQLKATNQPPMTNDWGFTVIDHLINLPAELAFPFNAGRQRGFSLHFVESANPDFTGGLLAQAEAQLAGDLGASGEIVPPLAVALTSPQTANLTVQRADIELGIQRGLFNGDQLPSGLVQPVTNLAMEILAYLNLDKGSHRFGVHCSDAFRLMAGRNPYDTNLVLAEFDAPRTADEIQFDFMAEATGIYPFRLVWQHEGDEGSLEWYSIDRNTGVRTLINDTTKPNPVLAYRQVANNFPPIMILQEPANLTVSAGLPAAFEVAITNRGAGNTFYQWQVNGAEVPGANSSKFVIPVTDLADNGKRYRCMITVPGFFTQITGDALLRVEPGSAPYVVQAVGSRWLDSVQVVFSEAMEFSSSQNPGNYQFEGGLAVLGAVLDSSGRNVVLFTDYQVPGQTYTLQVQNVLAASGTAVASNATATVTAFGLEPGLVLRQVLLDVEGSQLTDLEGHERFLLEQFDWVEAMDQLDAPRDLADNYGQRLTGYLVAPATGDYRFFVAAGDQAELRLSSSTDRNVKVSIASVPASCDYRQWTAYPETQQSAPISLVAGERYFFEVVHKAGAGSDHVEVAWVIPGEPAQTNIIGSAYLAMPANPELAGISIIQQPEDTSVSEGEPATFTVFAQGHSEYSTNLVFQWQRNGTNLPSAQRSVYVLDAAGPGDNQAKFRCAISVPGKTELSAEAILTVESQPATKLRLQRGPQSLVLLWDTPPVSPDYGLESTTNFVSAAWTPLASTPSVSNGISQVVLPVSDRRSFFRLRR